MKTVNLREVRVRLPFGSLVKISEKLGLSLTVVSGVFRGKYPGYKNSVLEIALEMINAKQESEKDIIEKAEKLGVANGEFSIPYQRKKKRIVEKKVRYSDLFKMNEGEMENYLRKVNSKLREDDFSGMFTSAETAYRRFLYELCKEQNIKVLTIEALEKMNRQGLNRTMKEFNPDYDPESIPNDPEGEQDLREILMDRYSYEE